MSIHGLRMSTALLWKTRDSTTVKSSIDHALSCGLNALIVPLHPLDLSKIKAGDDYYYANIEYAHTKGMEILFLLDVSKYADKYTFIFNTTFQNKFVTDLEWILQHYPNLDGIELEEPVSFNYDDPAKNRELFNAFFTRCKLIVDTYGKSRFNYGFNLPSNQESNNLMQGTDITYIDEHRLFTYFDCQAGQPTLNNYIYLYNMWIGRLSNIELSLHTYLTYSKLIRDCIPYAPDWNHPDCWNQAFFDQIKWSFNNGVPFSIFTFERLSQPASMWPNDTTPGATAGDKVNYILSIPPIPTPQPEEGMIRVYITATGNIVTLDIESQYLPYVVVAENASAPWESMKAQAIAARTVAYHKLLNPSGTNFDIYDDIRDQIYNPNLPIYDIHKRSVSETKVIHLEYANVTILAFYVSGIGDYLQYVTFNEGKIGDDITQTTLGYTTDPPSLFPYNRGCMGQVQANDLAQNDGYTVDQILKYFYGADIIIIPPLPTPTPPPLPTPVPGILIQNPGFESGTTSWWVDPTANVTLSTVSPGYEGDYAAKLIINDSTNVQLFQPGITLEPDTRYRLTFAAYSTTGHDIAVRVLKHVSPYTIYGLNTTFNLSTGWQVFTVEFTTTGFTSIVNDGRLQFWLDPFAAAGDIYYISDIKLKIVPAIPQEVKYSITIESVPPGALIKVDGIAKTTSVYSVGGLNIIEQILRDM